MQLHGLSGQNKRRRDESDQRGRSVGERRRALHARGFSLIELMVVVAIIAILAAIAYPNYVDKVRRSRRVEAKSLLLRAANREEQLFSANNRYLNSMSALGFESPKRCGGGSTDGSVYTENCYYKVSVYAGSYKGTDFYTLTATAQNDQVKDTCRTILLDSKGLKSAWSGAAANQGDNVADTCW